MRRGAPADLYPATMHAGVLNYHCRNSRASYWLHPGMRLTLMSF